MNKQEILEKCENDDDKLLVSKLLDKIDFVNKRNTVEHTDFLDIRQKSMVEKILKNLKYDNYIIFGGYENAERTMAILYPEKLSDVFENKRFNYGNIMEIIRITLPNEMRGKYTHRDYLGAVIKVGVKREKVGDIIVSLDGADIIVDNSISNYLVSSFADLTRFSKSSIEKVSVENINILPQNVEELNIIIPSMRADSIVSELIKTSRSKANEFINAERVFVNFEIVNKSSKMLKDGDILTVRGKGRFKICEILNTTKKGNLVVKVEKYV